MVRLELSDAERARIGDAVARAEAGTGAQLVVAIAQSCGAYGLFAVLWAALAALLAGALAALAAPWLGAASLVLVEGIVFVILAAALSWKRLLPHVVPPSVRRAHAREVAEHQFAARVGGRTERGVGVLLFVALAERQVFILPDSGVAAAIEAARWEAIVARLVSRARTGALGDAIVEAIEAASRLLAPAFPAEMPPENPLPDDIVELGDAARRPPPSL
jgi:putative membrane protein